MKKHHFFFILFLITNAALAQITFKFCGTSNKTSTHLALDLTVSNNSGSPLPANYSVKFNWSGVSNITTWYGLTIIKDGSGGLVELQNATGNPLKNGSSITYTIELDYVLGMTPPSTGAIGTSIATGITCYVPSSYENFTCERKLSTNCFVPTGGGSVVKEIQIGEGTVYENGQKKDVYIPTNRKGWAIAAAVSHTLFSNLMGFDAVSINKLIATSVNEVNCGCDDGAIAPAWVTNKYPKDELSLGCAGNAANDVAAGFFQIQKDGWAGMQEVYTCFLQSDPGGQTQFNQFIKGAQFETASILKTYYDYGTVANWQYKQGLDPISFFKKCKDPYAAVKMLAYAYNKGVNSNEFSSIMQTNRTAAMNYSGIG
jgi:hypothetical protein